MLIRTILIQCALISLLWGGCGKGNTGKDQDTLLAQVYNKNLYLSELDKSMWQGTTKEDSALVVSAAVQRWVQEQLMMYEAERNIPKDSDIDELVRNYRASLIRFNFEEQTLGAGLDSVVRGDDLLRYYDDHKDQFQLESTILKCQILKLRPNAPQNEINKLWGTKSESERARLEGFAKQWALISLLDREKWYKLEEVAAILPKGTLTSDNIGSRREGSLSDDGHRYYYKVLDVKQGSSLAPFDYVKDQATKMILHKRKSDFIEKWKADLYQKEIKRENVKIF